MTSSECVRAVAGSRGDAVRVRRHVRRPGGGELARERSTSRITTAVRAGRTVVLVGPAGIGKSTLLERWMRRSGPVVARCLPAFSTMAYRPLSHALGQPLSGTTDEVATDIVAALGDHVLAIEDVHWADPATAAVLGELIGRVPLVVTTRSSVPFGDHPLVDEIEIAPLDPLEAAGLSRRLHPGLSETQHAALVDASGGNPLLIEHLAHDGDVSTSVRDAIADRIATLPDSVVDDLGRLALLDGAPAGNDLVHALDDRTRGLTTDVGDGNVRFTHELLATAVEAALGEERLTRLRRELATRLPPAAACRHLLALGERAAAAHAACEAAEDSDPNARADLLALAVDALGEAASARLRLDAAAAANSAHRPDDARRFATAAQGDDGTHAEAGLHLARATWLGGDPATAERIVADALARVRGTGSEIEAELVVERAFIAVRRRVGDPTIVELADAAVELATQTGTARARALNTAGLSRSHVGLPGWSELFDAAHAAATEEDDDEEQLAARYWLLSALGFYGPMPEAIALGAEMVEQTQRLAARRWYHHFLGAHIVHLASRGDVPDGRVAEAREMLRQAPHFRNRAQVELALVAALVDRGDLDECDRVIAAGEHAARGGEDVALLACARCELALARRDVAAMTAALTTIVESGAAFFGVNAIAESAAINLAFGAPAEIAPPATVTTLTPVLDVVRIEREAHDLQLAGDIDGAISACRAAAEQWTARGLHRFGRRARLAQVEIAVAAGELERARRLLATVLDTPPDVTARRRRQLDGEIVRRLKRAQLTSRELEILELVGNGFTSRQIAEQLGISAATVDSHVDRAMRRLGARTRVHAASLITG